MKKLTLAAVLVLILPLWAGAQRADSAPGAAGAIPIEILRDLAQKGDAEAQYRLAVEFATGREVPKDDVEAVKWYRKAAEQGDAKAQFVLGIRYDDGRGVHQDYVMAHVWYNLAAARAKGGLREYAVAKRDRVAAIMTADQVAEAQRIARRWKQKK